MSCSYVERKESHVDLGLRALHDPDQPFDLFQSGRSKNQVAHVYGQFRQSR
jgi:hypothetical protein